MGNLHTYLKSYGKYDFYDRPFNEVDNVILSLITYIDFDGIVSKNKIDKITLLEASNLFYEKYDKKKIDSFMMSIRHASKMLGEIANTNRFKDVLLYNFSYKVDHNMQFGAITIKIPNQGIYIGYKGTDSVISGWKEDFMFTYMFPTPAQTEAINYLNNAVNFLENNIYVGGHSKGGNLALVASMYCKSSIRHKIKIVFSNDGPGLRIEEFNSKEYKKILPKLKSFIPRGSIVGLMLNRYDNSIVIDSKNKSIMQHDITSWLVVEDKLKRSNASNFSEKFDVAVDKWVNGLTTGEKAQITEIVFDIFDKADIHDLCEIGTSKLKMCMKLLKEAKNLPKEQRDMVSNAFKALIGELR